MPPAIYVTKVKNLLTGQAATLDEITAVENDPTQLGALVDTWFATPAAQIKMRGLYGTMFQVSQVAEGDLGAPFGQRGQAVFGATLVQQFRDSFPSDRSKHRRRTTIQFTGDGLTTSTVWMTPPMMAYYLLTDDYTTGDNEGKHTVRHPMDATTTDQDGNLHIWFVYDSTGADYTIDKSLNRSDATHFMHFWDGRRRTPGQIPVLQWPTPRTTVST